MSDAADAVGGIVGGIGDAISGAVKAVSGVISGIGNAISGVVSGIGKTVNAILKNPLPTLLQVAGAYVGIPPYVTAAVITASRGGNLEDIAKTAAVSYATTSFMADTEIGADIKNYTTNAWSGDFTDSMMEKFNLPADTAVQISKVASASLNSSLVGGINAALTGRPIGQGIASGFTSGLVYASTDSYFNSINKDPNWGFSEKALNVMKGATSTALNTIISGKGDPAQALGNYIAYATINIGGTSLAQSAKDAYKLLTTDTEAAKAAQDKYTLEKANYDTKVTAGEALRNGINTDAVTYQKILDEQYNPFKKEYDKLSTENETAVNTFNTQKKIFDENKWAYDNYEQKLAADGYSRQESQQFNGEVYYTVYGDMVKQTQYTDKEGRINYVDEPAPTKQSFADTANAAAKLANTAAETATSTQTQAQTLHDNNKTMLDGLSDSKAAIDKKIADLSVIKKDVEDVTVEGSTAAKLKAAADAYQTKYDAWSKTKDAADRSAENYTKALAEVATRDATIDALNTGAIKVTSKDADGNWTLSNGMILTNQGKFTQDGQQVFTNAAGIPQKVMDFTATDGSKIDFNNNAGRVMSGTDVAAICKRDYGFTPSDAEIATLAGATYSNTGNQNITSLADKKARDAYFTAVGKEPTSDQISQFKKSGDVIGSAADAAINGLDLPPNYVPPAASVDQKISFGQAYSEARKTLGPNADFEWNGKKYTTENREEQIVRVDNSAAGAGKYDKDVSAYTKYRLLDNLSSPDFNPADLTKGEMTKFVDAYTKAEPLQRAAMLKGPEAATYKVIDTLLGETARYNPTGEVVTKFTGKPSGNISAYNPTGVEKVLDAIKTGANVANAGLDLATADVAGVVTRGAQLLRDSIGLDNTTADKIQQMWSNSKDKTLKSLATDDQRVIAGGIASGLESIGAFAATGPVGSLMTLGAIAANNAYQEGATTWVDNNGKAYSSKEEATRAAGQSNIRQLTQEENMQRTAVMTVLEIAGEAAGLPGMARLMKGIPLTGSAGQIVNAVKNFGVGLGNELVSELLTTTAQMAADKWASFGLGKDATLADFTKALQDTALATTAAVGTAGSISIATKNMLDLKNYANPFSTNVGIDKVEPNVPSLKQAAAALGINESDFASIQQNISNGVRAGNAYIGSAEDLISQTLQDKGMSAVKADAIASQLGSKLTNVTVSDFLTANGINAAQAPLLANLISAQIDPSIDTGVAAKNIASIFASAGMDTDLAGKTASKFYLNTIAAPTLSQSDIDLSNQLLKNVGINVETLYTKSTGTTDTTTTKTTTNNVSMDAVTQAINAAIAGIKLPAGVSMDSVVTAIKNFAAQNPTLSAADVTSAVKDYMTANPSITTADVNTAVTNATKGLAIKADIANAIANIKLPAGITAADVTSAIQDYMSKNAGLNLADVTSAVATYMTNHPGLAAADIKTAISDATKDFATKKDIETAIAGIKFPNGLSAADVSAQITAALKANPGLTAADVTTAITAYMTAHPGVSAADVSTAITAATKDLVSTKTFNTAIEGLGLDVKTKFDSLTQGQKDIVKAYTQQGVDLNKAINDSAKLTADQITGVKTQLTALTGDVKTKFDALTQGQKDIVNSQVQMGVDLNAAINNAAKQTTDLTKNITDVQTQLNTRINDLVKQGVTIQEATNQAIKETQGQVTDLGTSLNTRINDLVKQGVTIQEATNQAIKETQGQIQTVKTDLTKNITDVQTQFNTRVNELMKQGQDYQTATQNALKELSGGVTDLKKQEEERVKAEKAKTEESRQQSSLSQAVSILAPTAAALVDTSSPGFKDIGYKNTGATKFESVLSPFEKMVEENSYANKPQTEQQPQPQQAAPVNENLNPQKPQQEGSDYFNYGTQNEIDQMLGSNPGTQMLYSKAGGLATPLMAGGGSTRYGRYAGGGLPVVQHSGKARVDFRHGDAVTGPGDGQSDDIPAMLADGEFVFPADVVAALGNGSTKAGSDKLYDMMHSIRAYHRSAKPKDLPPPAKKSPLDYLTKPARKARR